MAKSSITFDPELVSPEALRMMADEATKKMRDFDGKSAAHYSAWRNLAQALKEEADRRGYQAQQARLPKGCELWGNYGDGLWRVRNSFSQGIRFGSKTPKAAVDRFLESGRAKG